MAGKIPERSRRSRKINEVIGEVADVAGLADAHAATTSAGVHGSSASATPGALVHRDANGRAQVAAPSALADIARLDTVLEQGTNVLLVRPDAEYAYNGGAIMGTLKVTLPFGWTNTMVRATIEGYTWDAAQAGWKIVVGGYNYAGTPAWLCPRADIVGKPPTTTVRLGYDSAAGKCCILIGTTSTVWTYPQVRVTQVLVGYQGLSNDWTTGWSISVVTDESSITNIVSVPVDAAVSCRQGTRRIETKTGSASVTGTNGNVVWTITVTFDNAFTSSVICMAMPAPGSSGGLATAHCGITSLSSTGASGYFLIWLASGNYTSIAAFLAVGT